MTILQLIALIQRLKTQDLTWENVDDLTREILPIVEAIAGRDLVHDAHAVAAVKEIVEAVQAVARVVRTLPERVED